MTPQHLENCSMTRDEALMMAVQAMKEIADDEEMPGSEKLCDGQEIWPLHSRKAFQFWSKIAGVYGYIKHAIDTGLFQKPLGYIRITYEGDYERYEFIPHYKKYEIKSSDEVLTVYTWHPIPEIESDKK